MYIKYTRHILSDTLGQTCLTIVVKLTKFPTMTVLVWLLRGGARTHRELTNLSSALPYKCYAEAHPLIGLGARVSVEIWMVSHVTWIYL